MSSDQQSAVFVVDGCRTPFLKAKGVPGPFTPTDLAVWAGRPLLLRQPFEADAVDEVILGCVNPRHDEVNPGRVAALRLGCGADTPGWTVQRNCASGMQSVHCGVQSIAAGRTELVLAGGTEALSHAPLLLSTEAADWLGRWQQADLAERARILTELRPAQFAPVAGLRCGLTDPYCGLTMGQTAEILAHRYQIDRQAADTYAVRSHQRLATAVEEERMTEIEPMFDRDGNCHETDDGLRGDTSLESLERLPPVFEQPYGQVTAGNSSQVTDGASWLLLASARACDRHQLTPMGRVTDTEWVALPPEVMGLGPVFAVDALLARRGLALDDIDLWEINEAFAAQVLACLEAWADEEFCRSALGRDGAVGELQPARLNVDGGAIALGHPVGTSGNRIVLHLLHALRHRHLSRGIATECVGGGQGGAMLLEAV